MFFARQKSNKCGLHAIQNMFKSAKVTDEDMHQTCLAIKKNTGDHIHNHESFGGDWSVQAVLQTVVSHGYDVSAGIRTTNGREWAGPPLKELLKDDDFRGMIVHQPVNRHFTCLRPEENNGERKLYYIDSQSSGPVHISSNLASRRCLAAAYMWEPYIVRGPEMEYVKPPFEPEEVSYRAARGTARPSEDFMRAWRSLSNDSTTRPEEKEPQLLGNPHGSSPELPEDGDI